MEEDVVWSKVGEGAPRQTYDKTSNGPHTVFYVPGLLKMEASCIYHLFIGEHHLPKM
jgi:hypothetical protein